MFLSSSLEFLNSILYSGHTIKYHLIKTVNESHHNFKEHMVRKTLNLKTQTLHKKLFSVDWMASQDRSSMQVKYKLKMWRRKSFSGKNIFRFDANRLLQSTSCYHLPSVAMETLICLSQIWLTGGLSDHLRPNLFHMFSWLFLRWLFGNIPLKMWEMFQWV